MNFEVFHINGYNIKILFRKGIVHILNSKELNDFLKKEKKASLHVALFIKNTYKEKYKKDISITLKSLTIEILGHVYLDRIAKFICKIVSIVPLFKKSILKIANKFVLSHTDIIDIGEKQVDNNRWVWDSIAIFTPSIFFKMKSHK